MFYAFGILVVLILLYNRFVKKGTRRNDQSYTNQPNTLDGHNSHHNTYFDSAFDTDIAATHHYNTHHDHSHHSHHSHDHTQGHMPDFNSSDNSSFSSSDTTNIN